MATRRDILAEVASETTRTLAGSGGTVELYTRSGKRTTDPRRAVRFFVPEIDLHLRLSWVGEGPLFDVTCDTASERNVAVLRTLRRLAVSRLGFVRVRPLPSPRRPESMGVMLGVADMNEPAVRERLAAATRRESFRRFAALVLDPTSDWKRLVAAAKDSDHVLAEVVRRLARAPGGRRALVAWVKDVEGRDDDRIRDER